MGFNGRIFFVFLTEFGEVVLDIDAFAELLLEPGLVVLFLALVLAEVDGGEVRGLVGLVVIWDCLLQGRRFRQRLRLWDAGRFGNIT